MLPVNHRDRAASFQFDPCDALYGPGPPDESAQRDADGCVAAGRARTIACSCVGKGDGMVELYYAERLNVWPTLEVVVMETPSHLMKQVEETGLALIGSDE